jgi:hypothetical protein
MTQPSDPIAYRVVDPFGDVETVYLCVDCGQTAANEEWWEGLTVSPVTDPNELPEGPPRLAPACGSPWCNARIEAAGVKD